MISRVKDAIADGRLATLMVIGGGLLTLQSSEGLSPLKVAYLLLAAAALAAALAGVRPWLSSARAPIATPWLVASAAFAVMLAFSFIISRDHDTSLSSWLRDVASYALFGAAPVFGLACARSALRRWIIAALVVCGALASLSFTVEWVGRRHILDLPIDRIVLPTGGLSSALLALATAFALAGAWKRQWWAVGAGAVLGFFFLSGSRSTLLLLAVPIGAGLLAGRPWRRTAQTVLVEGIVAVAIFVVADLGIALSTAASTQMLGPNATSSPVTADSQAPNGLQNRLVDTGSLLTDPGSDASFQDRWTETTVAWQAFLTSPLAGVGPGYSFLWTRTGNIQVSAYTLDTPVIYLAKFGLVGLIPLLLFAAAYLRMILALWRQRSESEIEFLAICGYGIVLVLTSLLGSPMEDKGVSFAAILLIAFGCRALVTADQDGPAKGPLDLRPALVGLEGVGHNLSDPAAGYAR